VVNSHLLAAFSSFKNSTKLSILEAFFIIAQYQTVPKIRKTAQSSTDIPPSLSKGAPKGIATISKTAAAIAITIKMENHLVSHLLNSSVQTLIDPPF
jgi:hypothetical protein